MTEPSRPGVWVRLTVVAVLAAAVTAFLVAPGAEQGRADANPLCVKDTTSGNSSQGRAPLNVCVSPAPVTIRIERGYFDGLRYEGTATLTVADGSTRNVGVYTFRDLGIRSHGSYPTNNFRLSDTHASRDYRLTITSGDPNTKVGSQGVYSTMYGSVDRLHLFFGYCSLLNYSFASTWNWVSASEICNTTITAYVVHSYRAESTSGSNRAPVDLRQMHMSVTP
ncbi:hypothetical protein [Nocardioides limicola]|uniref:hypothetical protein n=1 Tax=Nocardioides limicola TaxID=2803368 RepID=UPI00193B366E|nr:hypothetical protein [Nocardioides sp. DJM-14]